MPTDYITIIICTALLILASVTPFINPFFRKPKEKKEDGHDGAMPKLSVIISVCDNARELRNNLPALLSQDYPAGFEIIVVVDDKTEHETNDILEQYNSYPNLYTTFVPKSSRYMSRKKLAITIGIKAAKHEWIVMTDAGCRPLSDKWLATMAKNCGTDTNIVIGYSNYSDKTGEYKRFERLRNELYCMRQAIKGTAYRTAGNNIMFRKSEFMNGRGFEGNLKYLRGEYDFIINKYAKQGCTAVETSPEAWVEEDAPTKKAWKNKHLFYKENRRHMANTTVPALLYIADKTAMYLNYAVILAAMAAAYLSMNVVMAAAAVSALLVTVILRTIIAHKTAVRFGAGIKKRMIVFLELSLLLHDIRYALLYKFADKDDFICHKL